MSKIFTSGGGAAYENSKGETASLQLDSAGNLLVSVAATSVGVAQLSPDPVGMLPLGGAHD